MPIAQQKCFRVLQGLNASLYATWLVQRRQVFGLPNAFRIFVDVCQQLVPYLICR